MPYFTNFFRFITNLFSTKDFGKYFAKFFSNTSCVLMRQPPIHISLPYYLTSLFYTPIFIPLFYIPSLYFLSLFYFTYYVI